MLSAMNSVIKISAELCKRKSKDPSSAARTRLRNKKVEEVSETHFEILEVGEGLEFKIKSIKYRD